MQSRYIRLMIMIKISAEHSAFVRPERASLLLKRNRVQKAMETIVNQKLRINVNNVICHPQTKCNRVGYSYVVLDIMNAL